MKLILASSSPRRRELLASIALDFDVMPSHVPEVRAVTESAAEYVQRLSREKAAEIARQHPSRWIVAADTTVLLGDELLEKPSDPDDARRMLAALSGKTHTVFTGVTLQNVEKSWLETELAETSVTMLAMRPADIEWYVGTGEPLDKAGAYAAQGRGGIFIDSIHGSFTNVVGLPLAVLFGMLRKAGIDPVTS
jgi:septum formation protein